MKHGIHARTIAFSAALALLASGAAEAQRGTSIRREPVVASADGGCRLIAPPAEVPAERQNEARRHVARARQALLIGDEAAAREALRQASESNPRDAEASYLLARAHEAAGEREAAHDAYCRTLAVAPSAPEATEIRERLVALAPQDRPTIPDAAVEAFREGVTAYDAGRAAEAVSAFTRAIGSAPAWPDVYYNRALAHERASSAARALEDYERYLRLRPEAEDRAVVVRRIASLRPRSYDPSTALASGLVIPGMGQFYTRRPVAGVLVMGAVGGATYLALRETAVPRVVEAVDPFGNPYEFTVFDAERRHLLPGVAVAGAILVGSAVEAFLHARRGRRAALSASAAESAGWRDVARDAMPIVTSDGRGLLAGVRLTLPNGSAR